MPTTEIVPNDRPDTHASPEGLASRRSFLSWTGAAGAGLVLAACATDAPTSLTGPSGGAVLNEGMDTVEGAGMVTVDGPTVGLPLSSDTDILKFALFLELLEAEFYKMAVPKRMMDGSRLLNGWVREVSADVRDHEICHVDYLRAALGPAATGNRITFNFGNTLQNERTFLNAAVAFEQTGVGAYLGALPLISDKNIRSVAGTIFTIEARHTAAFRALNRLEPAPVAYETPLSAQQVVNAISPFVVEGL